ncbi:hypothetical protein LUX73_11620 [Actinomadura madurae]|nr:hypothetical protein [Actinomadura madurae]MCQ0005262.1 hypothetical protein [Actinomadura madurae]
MGVRYSVSGVPGCRAGRAPRVTAVASPARSSEVLPIPDGPTTTAGCPAVPGSASRLSRSATARSRPKNQRASCSWNDVSPGYGHAAVTGSTASENSAPPAASTVSQARANVSPGRCNPRSSRLK